MWKLMIQDAKKRCQFVDVTRIQNPASLHPLLVKKRHNNEPTELWLNILTKYVESLYLWLVLKADNNRLYGTKNYFENGKKTELWIYNYLSNKVHNIMIIIIDFIQTTKDLTWIEMIKF